MSPISAECYSSFLCILGLPESQLSKIKAEHHGKPGEFLREGINCLLRENFNTDKFGLLTWRRLVEAVADTAGGNDHRLARKIIAKHKGTYVVLLQSHEHIHHLKLVFSW